MDSQGPQKADLLAYEISRVCALLTCHSRLGPVELRLIDHILLSHFRLILKRPEGLGTLVVMGGGVVVVVE
jgi:hypothetical protein